MRGRRLLALGGLCTVLLLAGCLGGGISEEQLGEDENYTWDDDAAASYTLDRSSYTAVYDVENRSSLSVHDRDALGIESSIGIRALQFRYRNGTVVNATHPGLTANTSGDRTNVAVPAETGQVAYTAPRNGKQFNIPVAVEGAQSVTLPPGARVGIPLLSSVSPGNYTTDVADGRMAVRWANRSSGTLSVQYYLERDILVFGLLLLIGLVAGGGGALYYLRQIRHLESQREEIGLDVNQDDDDPRDRGPPPGMR